MDLVEITLDLAHRQYGRQNRLVIYEEALIAAKFDHHIVIRI
jgi:hypothetical protein